MFGPLIGYRDRAILNFRRQDLAAGWSLKTKQRGALVSEVRAFKRRPKR